MKVPELKAEAKRLGLRGYSHTRKPELFLLSTAPEILLSLMTQFQKLILKFSNRQNTLNQELMRPKRRNKKEKSENSRKCLD